ncbi:hypothetical protein K7432_010743 [Basidiobolus ranarum]
MLNFQVFKYYDDQLCEELGNCPIQGPGHVTFARSLKLSKLVPFVNVKITSYLQDERGGEYGCFYLERDQTDQTYFRIINIVVLYSVLFSVLVTLIGFFLGKKWDIFAFSSKMEISEMSQNLQYPGPFGMVYYLQYAVITALLNLNYPYFYQSFISSFHSTMFVLGNSVLNQAARQIRNLAVIPAPTISPDQHGFSYFAHYVGLDEEDLLASTLIVLAIVLGFTLVLSVLASFVALLIKTHWDGFPYSRKKIIAFVAGNTLRVQLLFHLPLTLFAFHQIYLNKSLWLTVVAAIVVAILSLGFVGTILGHILRIAPQSIVFIDSFYMLLYGPLYNGYTSDTCRFAIIDIGYHIALAAIVAFGQKSGLIQLILLLCLEVGVLYGLVRVRPWISSTVNRWEITRQTLKIVVVSLLFAFVPPVYASDIAKEWCGLIIILLILSFQLAWIVKILSNILTMVAQKCKSIVDHTSDNFKEESAWLPNQAKSPSIESNTTCRFEYLESVEFPHDGAYYPGFNNNNRTCSSLQASNQMLSYPSHRSGLYGSTELRYQSSTNESYDTQLSLLAQNSTGSQATSGLKEYPYKESTSSSLDSNLPKFFSTNN